MQEPLTDAEKAQLLAELGMTEHAEAFATPTAVAEVVVTPRRKSTQTIDVALSTVPMPDVEVDQHDIIAADLLKRAHGNLDTAKQLAINWAQAEFDKVKLSKVQAAALGVDKTAHNKAEYARIQAMRERINTHMRRQARGHVATKIAKAKTEANPELDAFLLKHQGNPEIETLMKILGR